MSARKQLEPALSARPPDAAPARPVPMPVVVAYADRATRQRALRIYDHLHEELGDEFDFQFTWWKFDFLADNGMFDAAVEAAVEAELIIFAVHAGEPLPPPVRTWIETWKARRERRRSALVALIGATGSLSTALPPVHSLLHGVAQEAGMEFFPHAFPLLTETPCCLVDKLSDRATRLTTLLEEILTCGPGRPDWGINE